MCHAIGNHCGDVMKPKAAFPHQHLRCVNWPCVSRKRDNRPCSSSVLARLLVRLPLVLRLHETYTVS
jgi:hypothetical protein